MKATLNTAEVSFDFSVSLDGIVVEELEVIEITLE